MGTRDPLAQYRLPGEVVDMTQHLGRYGVPVEPAVTRRTLCLLEDARSALAQAIYEGSHLTRQDPAPAYGTPWTEPDLPAEVLQALRTAQDAIAMAHKAARQAAAANPVLART